ncbi:MAG: RnfABCDGE type electron transport complex subunit G [Bacteroidales bacterium]|nr:RnfABCDGE type electron transport complex subunit G [Bacteroidales bacterium]
MAKNDSIWRLVIVLTCISLLAALALTGVYALTKGPIEQGQREKKEKALQSVLPAYEGTVRDTVVVDADNEEIPVHLAIGKNGELCGAGIETYTKKAFAGRFDLMVGFDAEGTIVNTEVIKAGETPGLGDKINKDKSEFAMQFNQQNPAEFQLVVKKDGGDVDAITAATISSRAYCDAVQRAYDIYMKIKEEYHE